MKLEDKLAIHELLAKAAYYYDERDLTSLMALFDQQATMSLRIAGGDLIGPFNGRDAIEKLMGDSLASQTDRRRHLNTNMFFKSEGEARAEVTSILTLISVEKGELRVLSTATYQDTVINAENQWVISSRHVELDLPY